MKSDHASNGLKAAERFEDYPDYLEQGRNKDSRKHISQNIAETRDTFLSFFLPPSRMRALSKGGVMKPGTVRLGVLIDEETITACYANKTLRQS